jgi:hypothetical protein
MRGRAEWLLGLAGMQHDGGVTPRDGCALRSFAAMAADVRERPEAVEFRLEEEVGMIKRLRQAEEPHRGQGHGKTPGS